MSAGQYLLGIALVAIAAGSLAALAVRARRRLAPELAGAPARLAELVVGAGLALVLAQALGVVGALRPGIFAGACAAAALASRRLRAREPVRAPRAEAPPRRDPVAIAAAAAAGGLVALHWGGRVAEVLDRGMADPDSLWYHLPHAARFAQDGWTTRLHFTESEPITTFHPANLELLHAIGMSLMGGFDALSPFVNFGLAGLALLAGWCIGRRYGAAPAGLVAVAAVLLAPIMIQTQPGEAYNDVAGLAFFLAAVALLVSAGGPGTRALAAFAAGLALGTKLSLLAPAGALAVAAVLAARRGERRRAAGVWTAGLALGGGFWFLRNLARTGNPLPWFGFEAGPLSLPSPPNPMTDANSFSVAHYLLDTEIWRRVFTPALNGSLGPVWEFLVLAAVVGCLVAVADRDRRALGLVGLACFGAYVVTPAGAGGPEGQAPLFVLNLRFVTPALALGLVLLATARGRRTRRLAAPAPVALAVLTVSGEGLWPREPGRAFATVAVLALGGLALWALRRARPPRPRLAAAGAALLAVAVVAAGWRVQAGYFDARYAAVGPTLPRASVWAAQNLSDTRVGVVGYLLQYPLYGTRLTNAVEVIGERGPNGAFRPHPTCRGFVRAVVAGRYRYLVLQGQGQIGLGPAPERIPEPPEARWARTIAGASEVMRDASTGVSVFRLARPRPGPCA